MYIIEERNVHNALISGMRFLGNSGIRRESRAGDVIVAPCPVTTTYRIPTERVMFWSERDANPFFHFMEGLWMLDGRRDVQWIGQFNSTIDQSSADRDWETKISCN